GRRLRAPAGTRPGAASPAPGRRRRPRREAAPTSRRPRGRSWNASRAGLHAPDYSVAALGGPGERGRQRAGREQVVRLVPLGEPARVAGAPLVVDHVVLEGAPGDPHVHEVVEGAPGGDVARRGLEAVGRPPAAAG